ncbi:MAG TPA: hypothetical protein VNN18_03600 [Candidatus Xenobia bacterium]|nr:hypothetical protein [Candidatus Xenobia bacterium]
MHLPLAQTGLPDVTGGIFILAIVLLLGLLGIILCVVSVIYRKPLVFIAGLAAATPGLALVGYFIWLERPQNYEWDFSRDRSVAQLDIEPTYGRYYYQGNLHTTIRLPGGRAWSGEAGLVTFQADSGQVDSIYWDSRGLSTNEAYSEARRILGELGLEGRGLDAWHKGVEHNFNASTPEGSDPLVTLYMRRISPESEAAVWTIHVEVVWRSEARDP